MSLIHLITFNENSLSTVRDYSTNGNDSTGVTGLSIMTSGVGLAGQFSAGDNVNFGDINALDGLTNLTIAGRVDANAHGANNGSIYEKKGVWDIFVEQTTNFLVVEFTDNTTATATVTSTTAISGGFIDFMVTYASGSFELFINGVSEDTDSSLSGALDSTSNVIFMGFDFDGAQAFDGDIEWIAAFNTSLPAAAATSLLTFNQGFTIPYNEHTVQEGDLLIQEPALGAQRNMVVTLVEDANNIRVWPIGQVPQPGEPATNIGHIFDTARQDTLISSEDTDTGAMSLTWLENVDAFADLTNVDNIVQELSENGFIQKGNTTFLTANTTIVSNDRFVFSDSSGGAFTETLPASPANFEVHTFIDATGDAGEFGVTIAGNGNNINGAANLVLFANFARTTLVYNGTQWNIIEGGNLITDQASFLHVSSDFTDPTASKASMGVHGVVSGTGAAITTPSAAYDFTNHPGVWGLSTGSTTAGRVFILSQSGSTQGTMHVGVGGKTRVGTWYQVGAILSTAGERYVLRTGYFSMSLPNTIIKGIGFEYQDDQNGGRWQALTEDGIGETSVDTGILAAVNTYTFFEFEVNAAGTSIEFFMDGVSVATITTNIPSGTGFPLFYSTMIMKLTGTTSRTSYIDAYYIDQQLSR